MAETATANGLGDASLAEILLPSTSDAASLAYLNHLTTLQLETLLAEPATLQTQSHHLTSSLTSLTHTSYPTFLSLHQTTSSLSESLDSLESSLDSLLTTSLSALEDSAAGWKGRTENVLDDRRKARVVLEQHDKIRDLLEIPMLIDTCVRNGYFAEALSLAAHARSLSSSSKPPPLILASVLSEVQNSMTQMLLSLLATLHEPNRKLPALWKAVNFLRKMDMFGSSSAEGQQPEEQIALAFLGGREGCLKASLEGHSRDILRLVGGTGLGERDKEDMAKFLKRYMDIWREGVYDIITQFSTIFLERPPSSTPKTPSTPSAPLSSLYPLLTTYTSHALTTHLLPILSQTLPLLPISTLPSLLTQLTYCATAFSRVGMDFRGILGGLFSTAVATAVGGELKAAGAKWVSRVNNASGDASPLSPTLSSSGSTQRKVKLTLPSQWIIVSSLVASPPTQAAGSSATPAHVPPQILASYPPIAEYTNTLLGILNSLRLLAPVEILTELMVVLDDVLDQGGDALLAYAQRVCDEPREQDEKVVVAAGQAFFGVFVPFMRRALVEGVYGVPMASWEAVDCTPTCIQMPPLPSFLDAMTPRKVLRARVLSVGSFVFTLLLQIYGLYTSRTTPDNDAYAPNPYLVILFFVVQSALQVYWIAQFFQRRTTRVSSSNDAFREGDLDHLIGTTTGPVDPPPEPTQMAYVHTYSMANFFFATSILAWTAGEHLLLSQILMAFSAACQFYFVFSTLEPTGKLALTSRNKLTHLVAKTNAGITVLYLWTGCGALQVGVSRPAVQQQAHCGVLFLLLALASGPDPTLGIWLLLDLLALVTGNTTEQWRFAYFCVGGILFVVILSDWLMAWHARNTAPVEPDSHELYPHSREVSDDDVTVSFYDSADQIWLPEETSSDHDRWV
ncbi:Dor1-like family-domain-containing protein [Roridomyces roridus]|uniref:Conserved oligomeric Golgi complex subunit 8 n=1 Tax=Roridomyces roridus TaxID=1738132 RepID=A0AAD7B5T5_9AGAR|nr:Dor1-like family-domain-containing protein [Roridomyces roridus]